MNEDPQKPNKLSDSTPENGGGHYEQFVGNQEAWKAAVQAVVERDNEIRLALADMQSAAFYVDDTNPEVSEVMTQAFYERVDQVAARHDGPVLRLIFDRSTTPGSGPKGDQHHVVPPVLDACRRAGYVGDVTVDYTVLDPHKVGGATQDRGPWDIPSAIEEMAKRSGKQVVVVVDGFGKRSAEEWGFGGQMLYATFGRDVKATLIRTSVQQLEESVRNEWGSPWFGKVEPHIPRGTKSETLLQLERDLGRPFDPEQFDRFARSLSEVAARVRAGEQVCLQAPNNYGKTTALVELAKLPEGQGLPHDVVLATVGYKGKNLEDLRTGEVIKPAELKERGVSLLIVDEAGRADDIDNIGAEEALQNIELWYSIPVVRLYPGNDTPPNYYGVVSPTESR